MILIWGCLIPNALGGSEEVVAAEKGGFELNLLPSQLVLCLLFICPLEMITIFFIDPSVNFAVVVGWWGNR